jgi:hypothetical protein
MPPSIYLYVDDVDVMYARAVKAGATSIRPPADHSYGDRNAWIKDPFDNTWFIAAPIAMLRVRGVGVVLKVVTILDDWRTSLAFWTILFVILSTRL